MEPLCVNKEYPWSNEAAPEDISQEDEHTTQLHYEPATRPRHQRNITNPFRLMQLAREAAGESNIESANHSVDRVEAHAHRRTKAVFDDLQSAHSSITSRGTKDRAATTILPPNFESSSANHGSALEVRSGATALQVLPSPPRHLPESHFIEELRTLPPVPATLPVLNSVDPLQNLPLPPKTVPQPKLFTKQDLLSPPENGAGSIFVEIDLGPPPAMAPKVPFDLEGQSVPQRQSSVLGSVKSYFLNALTSTRSPSSFLSPGNGQVKLEDEPSVYRSDATRSSDVFSTLPSSQNGNTRSHVNRLQRDDLFLPEIAFSSSPVVSPNPNRRDNANVASSSTNMSAPEGSTIGEIYRQYGTSTMSPGTLELANNQSIESSNHRNSESRHGSQHASRSSYGDSRILLGVAVNDYHHDENIAGEHDVPTIGIEHARSEHLSVAASTVPSLSQANWRNHYKVTPDSRLARDESIREQMLAERQNRALLQVPEPSSPPAPVLRPLERDISFELRRVSGNDDSFEDPAYYEYEARYAAAHNDSESADFSSIISSSSRDTITQGDVRRRSIDSAFYNPAAIPTKWINSHDNVRVPIVPPPPIPERSPRRPRPASNGITSAVVSTRPSQDDDWVTEDGSMMGDFRRVGRPESFYTSTSDGQSARLSCDEYGSTDRITQHPAPMSGFSTYRRRDLQNGNRPVLLPVSDQYRVNGFPSNSSRLRPPNPVYQNPAPLRTRHQHPFSSSPPEVLSPSRQTQPREFRHRAQNQFPPTSSTITSDGSGTTARRPDSRRPRRESDRHERLSHTQEWMESTVTTGGNAVENGPRSNATTRRERPTSLGLVTAFAAGETVEGYEICDGRIVRTDGIEEEEEVQVHKTPRRVRSRGPIPVGDFRYRSPAAPPKSEAFRQLYTQAQLIEMDQLARNGLRTNRVASVVSNAPSQRHIRQAPALVMFEEPSLPPVLKQHWNVVYFIVCSFFPPFLLCYACGWLDHLLVKRTQGRMMTFSTKYKRLAFLLFVAELTAIIVAVAFTTMNKI